MFDKVFAIALAIITGIVISGVAMFPLLLWGNDWMKWLWVIVMLAVCLYIYLMVRPSQPDEWWG